MPKLGDFFHLHIPQCLIRFSHCEFELLCAIENPARMPKGIQRVVKFSNIHPTEEQMHALADELKECAQRATYIGGMHHVPRLAELTGVSAESIESRYIMERLLPYLNKAYTKRKYISCITCRNVEPFFADKDVDLKVYQIPSERKFRRFEGDYEKPLHNEPIYPDAIKRVRKEIVIREPGELFLIGAGVFGKILCLNIMDMGGFAVDVGSYMDQISNLMAKGRSW